MSKHRPRIPQLVRRALEETGLPYEIVGGGRHWKLSVCGQFAGIIPYGKHTEGFGAQIACKNTVAQIRRVAKQVGTNG